MSEAENPKVDEMTFGEAFAHARAHGWRLLRWGGEEYHIDLSADVARGFDVDLEHWRAKQKPFRNAYDYALARIDHLDRVIADLVEKNQRLECSMEREDPGNADIDAPIVGRMITDKRVDLLRIERQANGGWLVDGRKDVRDDYITRSDVSAAFTNTADMLRALADLLEQDDKKREEKADG